MLNKIFDVVDDNKTSRRRWLTAMSAGIVAGMAGCLEQPPVESELDDEDATADDLGEESNSDNENTEPSSSESDSTGLSLEVKKVSDDPPDRLQKTYRLKNVGDKRILATNAVEVWSERSPYNLALSEYDETGENKWAYGIPPGSNVEFEGVAKTPLNGVVYTPGDVPVSPPSDVDVAVEPNAWNPPSEGSEIKFELSNPTSVDLADLRDVSPMYVTKINDSTLQWRVRNGAYWTGKQEVTLDTTRRSESFTIAPSVGPQYDIEITEVTEEGNLSIDVTAQSELGVWNCRAVVFKWPGTKYGALRYVTKVQQEPTGADGRQGPLVTPTVGDDRIGETASYTLKAGSHMGIDFPIEEDQEIAVLLLVEETPVAYTSSPFLDFF